jgi:Phage capsid family.
VDTLGRPLIINNIQSDGSVPALLGQPVYTSKGVYLAGSPNRIGFAGDWTSALYGTVEGIQISISTEATLVDGVDTLTLATGTGTVDVPHTINLWQQNMFALRAEIEIGFIVRDLAHFVKLTDATIA